MRDNTCLTTKTQLSSETACACARENSGATVGTVFVRVCRLAGRTTRVPTHRGQQSLCFFFFFEILRQFVDLGFSGEKSQSTEKMLLDVEAPNKCHCLAAYAGF